MKIENKLYDYSNQYSFGLKVYCDGVFVGDNYSIGSGYRCEVIYR